MASSLLLRGLAVIEVLILPWIAKTYLAHEPLVAAAWLGLAVKTDGAAVAPAARFAHAMLAVMRFRRWIDDLPDSDQSLIDADRLSRLAVELDKNDSTCISIRRFVCALRRSFDLAAQTLILGPAIATRGVGANSNPEARSWPIDHVHGPSAVRNASPSQIGSSAHLSGGKPHTPR